MIKATDTDSYIATFPPATQKLLHQIRGIIRKAAPKAEEIISYGMPAYRQHGMLVYFAGYKGHIGFYPTGEGIVAFAGEIAGYRHSKGVVQFPIDQALPVALITRMVKHRVQVNGDKASQKSAANVTSDFTTGLSAPARRALAGKNITTISQLAKHSEQELLSLHGLGPGAIPVLKAALKSAGLAFKK